MKRKGEDWQQGAFDGGRVGGNGFGYGMNARQSKKVKGYCFLDDIF